MDNKIWIGIVIVAILLVGGYLLYNSGPVVSAQGSSSIKVVPDQVSININVETRNSTAQAAQDQNKIISEKLVENLVKLGFSKDELKFVNYYVSQDYDWNNGNQKIKGYIVSQQLVIKTGNVTRVPSIVDVVINSGALISYINFEVSDAKQTEYKNQALEQASKDAKTKAQSIAAGQGKRLGRLVSLTNQDYYYPGPLNYYSRASGVSVDEANSGAIKAATNLAPNEQEITASISAQYKIGLI